MNEVQHTWADVAYVLVHNSVAVGILVGAIGFSITLLACAFGVWIFERD